MLKRIFSIIRTYRLSLVYKQYSRVNPKYDTELTFPAVLEYYRSRDQSHAYFHHYFHNRAPAFLRAHRRYIVEKNKGYGEDSFHAMWWMLLNEYRPKVCLEIGVYRGQVISLWALIARELSFPCEVHGVSPFSRLGDSVSNYREDIDYLSDTLDTFSHFSLKLPILTKALSTDSAAVAHIASRKWDLIYIDGSHEYEVVLKDYRLCLESLNSGGILVVDDSSLGTNFHPPLFSFAGHPGPSQVVREYAMKEMEFLGAVGHNNVFRKRWDK